MMETAKIRWWVIAIGEINPSKVKTPQPYVILKRCSEGKDEAVAALGIHVRLCTAPRAGQINRGLPSQGRRMTKPETRMA